MGNGDCIDVRLCDLARPVARDEEFAMSRVQLALDVTDLPAAVAFYTKLFGVGPAKQEPGYANYVIEDPPLKLVLMAGERGGRLNHLGVEVEEAAAVSAAAERLAAAGLATDVREAETCCYALQDKVWVTDPDGARWEVYTVLADANQMACDGTSKCCEITAESAVGAAGCC
jgi:catechol 2,3-dioxygenase-like lactoylglutathione lyase family enzyme